MLVHTVDIQVRFSDTDMLGHVNNASFAAWAEIARLHFFEELGKQVRSLILASLYVDYRRQVEYTDRVRVDTWVERLGTSSVTLGQAVFANDVRAADIKSVVVHFDYAAAKSQALSPELRTALTAYLSAEAST